MSCLGEKFAVAGASAGVVASGVTVVVGAPTVVVGVGALVALIAALGSTVAALLMLASCLRDQGKETAAQRVEAKVAALQAELERLREMMKDRTLGDDGF